MEKMDYLFSDSDDDNTSSPPKKRGKHDLDLPELYKWTGLFRFRTYTLEPPAQVFKDMVAEFKKKIKTGKKAYNVATRLFINNKLAELEEKHPCYETSIVFQTIRDVQKELKDLFCWAVEILPVFEEDVDNYLKHRDTTLLEFNNAANLYYKKFEQLAEMPDTEKMMKALVYNVKHYKWIEEHSGLTQRDIYDILFFLRIQKQIYINVENIMDAEEFDSREMENLLNENKGAIKEICSLRSAREAAKAKAVEHAQKHEQAVDKHVSRIVGYLQTVDKRIRTMQLKFELLINKNVIKEGYDENFLEDWYAIIRNWKYCIG